MQLQISLITAAIYVTCSLGAVIVPGATWTDTSGNVIQAHGGGFLKVCIFTGSSFCGTQTVRLGLCSIGSVKISHTTVRCLKQFPVTRYAILVKVSVSHTSSVFRSGFVDTPKWCIDSHLWHQHIYLERCRASQRSVRRRSNDRLLMFSFPLVAFNKLVRSQP